MMLFVYCIILEFIKFIFKLLVCLVATPIFLVWSILRGVNTEEWDYFLNFMWKGYDYERNR